MGEDEILYKIDNGELPSIADMSPDRTQTHQMFFFLFAVHHTYNETWTSIYTEVLFIASNLF